MQRRLALHLPLLAAVPVAAQPAAPWLSHLADARAVGDGTFRWVGLRVYDATLWAPQGRFDPAAPHVLALAYHVAIPRARLVEASLDEMRRLGGAAVDDTTVAAWRARLQDAFPNVQPGDRLAALHRPGEGCRFFDADRERLQVPDARLAAAFFGIWLDPRTREPALRRRLLGASA